MSSLMDPDGANRIVTKQIKEWHAIRDAERDAKLLEPAEAQHRPSILSAPARLLGVVVGVLSGVDQRRAQRSGRIVAPAPDRPADIVDGPVSP